MIINFKKYVHNETQNKNVADFNITSFKIADKKYKNNPMGRLIIDFNDENKSRIKDHWVYYHNNDTITITHTRKNEMSNILKDVDEYIKIKIIEQTSNKYNL